MLKKTNYDAKVTEIENKLNNHNHDNTVAKANFDNTLSDLDSKIEVNKTKTGSTENKLNKLKTFDSSYFIGKSHFEEDGTQNYLVFQPLFRYFKVISNTEFVSLWQSKSLSSETIGPPPTSDNSFNLKISHYDSKIKVKFPGSCLKQLKIIYTHGTIVSIYIVYELGASSSHNNDPTLKNCLFGAVTSTKNADIEKYGYSGYGTGFDRRSSFSFPGGGFG